MKHLTAVLLAFFLKAGGLGLLVLGILDSSFLFAPLGNDLLVVAFAASHRAILNILYYAAMSTIGSVLGCLVVDVVFRKAGEEGLDKHLPRKRLEYVKRKVNDSAAWALAVASLAPPPFPFTPFVMAAAALEYPRRRMLVVVGVSRMIRFTTAGVLGALFGRQVLKWAANDVVQGFLLALVIACVIGSVVSVYGWAIRSRTPKAVRS
ncbi:MAG TPA: VTT domain-containing protein [Bryobacteraceae bacterium]